MCEKEECKHKVSSYRNDNKYSTICTKEVYESGECECVCMHVWRQREGRGKRERERDTLILTSLL